jgi:hypothetical protein
MRRDYLRHSTLDSESMGPGATEPAHQGVRSAFASEIFICYLPCHLSVIIVTSRVTPPPTCAASVAVVSAHLLDCLILKYQHKQKEALWLLAAFGAHLSTKSTCDLWGWGPV